MSTAPVLQLRKSDLFANLSADAFGSIEAELRPVDLPEGETLFEQGDPGDALYLLVEGELKVVVGRGSDAHTIDTLRDGALLGEMSLLTGEPRSAGIVASTPSHLLRLSKASFDALLAEHAEVLDEVTRTARPRIYRTRLLSLLSHWFRATDEADIHAIQDELVWHHLRRGDILFHEGDPDAFMYFVLGGRIGTFVIDDGEERKIREVGQGGSLGEVAMLTHGTHPATARALRDSSVVAVPRHVFESRPVAFETLAERVVDRNAPRTRVPARMSTLGSTASTYAFLPASPSVPIDEVVNRFASELRAWDEVQIVDRSTVDDAFGRPVADTEAGAPDELALDTWLERREADARYVVYQPDRDPTTAWSRRCVRRADRIALVASAKDDPAPGAAEDALARASLVIAPELLLIQDDGIDYPSGTAAWLEPRTILQHHHLRLHNDDDWLRVARLLTGRGFGLALSGGGARGFAHIGLMRALEEYEIPVDVVVGSSMGALTAASFAYKNDWRLAVEAARTFGDRQQIVDRTLPLHAIAKSEGVNRVLKQMFGDIRIEDLWIPFKTLSTNMTRVKPEIHDRGVLWRAVRASAAIPGIFTPILSDRGHILIDGGVMNNFPVDLTREMVGDGAVIAANAYGVIDDEAKAAPSDKYAFGDSISGWQALRERVNPFSRKRLRAPSIMRTLMRSTGLTSKLLMGEMRKLADVVVNYPTHAYTSLDFDEHEDIIALGYAAADEEIGAWWRDFQG